jgi:hypothetical protein
MFQQLNGLKRLSDLDEVRQQASLFLKQLSAGEI